MANAVSVARALIRLGAGEDEPDRLTHLRLQKLLYYVQGWSLALRGEAMFEGRIEAWPHGPVVRPVYGAFAKYGSEPIPPAEGDEEGSDLTEDDTDLIGSVWESLKGYSASGLRWKTHQESPWVDARRGLGDAESSNHEITQESIRAYFTGRTAGT